MLSLALINDFVLTDILGAELDDVYMTFEEERIRVSAVKSIQDGGLAWKHELQNVSTYHKLATHSDSRLRYLSVSRLQGYILDRVNGKRESCLQELDLYLSSLSASEGMYTVVFRFLKPVSSLELTPVAQDVFASHHLEAHTRKPRRQYQTSMKSTSRVRHM